MTKIEGEITDWSHFPPDVAAALDNYLHPVIEPIIYDTPAPLFHIPKAKLTPEQAWAKQLEITPGAWFPETDKYPTDDDDNEDVPPIHHDIVQRSFETDQPKERGFRKWVKQLKEYAAPEPKIDPTIQASVSVRHKKRNRAEIIWDRRNHARASKFGHRLLRTAAKLVIKSPQQPELVESVRPRRQRTIAGIGAAAFVSLLSLVPSSASGRAIQAEAAPSPAPAPVTSEAAYTAPVSIPNVATTIVQSFEAAQNTAEAFQFIHDNKPITVQAGSSVSQEIGNLLTQEGVPSDKIVPATVMLVNDLRMTVGNDLNTVDPGLTLSVNQNKIDQVLESLQTSRT